LAVAKRLFVVLFCAASIAWAEVHTLTLKQALDIAARQSPDILLARLDEQRAREQITVAQDPFRPKILAGSDAAYTSGYPNSIYGDAPRILGARMDMSFYNRPKHYDLKEVREQANGSQFALKAKIDDVAYQVTTLFLNAQELAGDVKRIQDQVVSATTIAGTVNSSVNAGYELPVERTRASVDLVTIQQRLEASRADQADAENQLAVVLGFSGNDSVRPLGSTDQLDWQPVNSESNAVELAFQRNKELAQLQSGLLAKQIEMSSAKSSRRPQIDLVAQYAMLTKRDYQDYFPANSIQRNNGQIGASIALPILLGPAPGGHLGQSQADFMKLRIQIDQIHNRIVSGVHRSYQQLQKAQSGLQLARQQLDLATSDLQQLNAQYEQGRVLLSQVDRARLTQNERALLVWQDQVNIRRAQLDVMRQVGDLMSTLSQR
jgi:outer membrane protein TolC